MQLALLANCDFYTTAKVIHFIVSHFQEICTSLFCLSANNTFFKTPEHAFSSPPKQQLIILLNPTILVHCHFFFCKGYTCHRITLQQICYLCSFFVGGGVGGFFSILYQGKTGFHFLLFLNKDVLYFFFLWDLNLCAKKGGYNNDVISTAICC